MSSKGFDQMYKTFILKHFFRTSVKKIQKTAVVLFCIHKLAL